MLRVKTILWVLGWQVYHRLSPVCNKIKCLGLLWPFVAAPIATELPALKNMRNQPQDSSSSCSKSKLFGFLQSLNKTISVCPILIPIHRETPHSCQWDYLWSKVPFNISTGIKNLPLWSSNSMADKSGSSFSDKQFTQQKSSLGWPRTICEFDLNSFGWGTWREIQRRDMNPLLPPPSWVPSSSGQRIALSLFLLGPINI